MIKMYGAWQSLAAYRVRVALNVKGLTYEEQNVDLAVREQDTPAFRVLNPQGAVPVLVMEGGSPLTQSLAILEFLEECYPDPPLLPRDPIDRARVRSLALLFIADHHPLVTPRVQRHLAQAFEASDSALAAWSRHWFQESLEQAEARLAADTATGSFCHGDQVTFADIGLASQLLGARALKAQTAHLPTVTRIGEACLKIDAFARAHPLAQPGAPADYIVGQRGSSSSQSSRGG